jgi:hypothetical protein
MVAFAQCMRDHGLADFPDPSSSGEMQINSGPGSDLDPSSAAFQSAQTACKKYEPSGGGGKGKPDPQMMARMLHFAQCMRAHGLPDFPDPKSDGGGISVAVHAGTNPNMDPNSPVFQAAQQACQSIMGAQPGMSTQGGGGSGGGSGPTSGTVSGGN